MQEILESLCRYYAVDAKVVVKRTKLIVTWGNGSYPLGLEKLKTLLVYNLHPLSHVKLGDNNLEFSKIKNLKVIEDKLKEVMDKPFHLR